MDASAILDYFASLKHWLDEQTKGQPIGAHGRPLDKPHALCGRTRTVYACDSKSKVETWLSCSP